MGVIDGEELTDLSRVEGITFDFFNTLIFHREGRGRRSLLLEYLQAHGLRAAPWQHRVLYDVFERHDTDYSPDAPQDERDEYYALLARRVFELLEVPASDENASLHASWLWQILGPEWLRRVPRRFGSTSDAEGGGVSARPDLELAVRAPPRLRRVRAVGVFRPCPGLR